MKLYNIANDGKMIFLLASNYLRLSPDLLLQRELMVATVINFQIFFVVGIIEVLQTSSVQPFTDKMKHFHDNIEFRLFEGGSTVKSFNTPDVLEGVYSYAQRVYIEMFNVGTRFITIKTQVQL